jgi:arginine decarboxylase
VRRHGREDLFELKQTYRDYLQARYGVGDTGSLNEFISRENGRLLFAGVDLEALVAEHGAPLEVAFCPLITEQIDRMRRVADNARAELRYEGGFVYAYATKANFSEEVVRTALASGAHYETSSVADARIATDLWRRGTLPRDRYVFCNGSKEDDYIAAITKLRLAGNHNVVPVVDDLDEWESYRDSPVGFSVGVRAREYARCSGGDRFGLLPDEIDEIVASLAGTPHRLVLYHAMVGSQLEDQAAWMEKLTHAVEAFCELRRRVPSLHMFNFGGGMPTSAYSLDFDFDYESFMRELFATIKATCRRYGVPVPDVVGEFGRYTVANHSMYLLEVGKVKRGRDGEAPWYLVNGSLMTSAPDTLIVDDQQFIVLPLTGWDDPAQEVRLGGRRTCDSDDQYPQPGQEPLVLPESGSGMIIAVFGVGAYQSMLGGKGGAHHCLNPEMKRVVIEQEGEQLVTHVIEEQSLSQIMTALGYQTETQPARVRRSPAPRVRKPDLWRTMVKGMSHQRALDQSWFAINPQQ